jgi:hypothetical protein
MTTAPASGTTVVVLESQPASVGMSFRIFQDMRGVQATYRITPATTTTITTDLTITDSVINVNNASALPSPDFANNIWGVITIGAERIMYRHLDLDNNTIGGLLRGTAGTAIAEHASGDLVYDMSRNNLLPLDYQNYISSNSAIGDGTTTTFTASDIDLSIEDSDGIEVYVGGIRVTAGYELTSTDPCQITFDTAPELGVEVTILIKLGVTWYAPGSGTASNGDPLQITETAAARFLRGV